MGLFDIYDNPDEILEENLPFDKFDERCRNELEEPIDENVSQ